MRFTWYNIHNPTSSELGPAGISQLKYVKEEYDRVFLAIKHMIQFKIARVDKQNNWEWIFWGKIPSERISGLYYDVIATQTLPKDSADFKNSDVKIWSNVPSFTFNYTYVCNQEKWDTLVDGKIKKEKLLPLWLIPKCSKKALVDRPKIRNPLEIWHLEKYAVLFRRYIFTNGYLNIKYIMRDLDASLTPEDIFKAVDSQEDKLSQANVKRQRDEGESVNKDTPSAEL